MGKSDHKPLEKIAKKSFHEIPKRLQHMYLRLQKNDVKIIYVQVSRTLLFIADALLYLTKSVDVPNDVVGKEGFSIQLEETNLAAEEPIAGLMISGVKQPLTYYSFSNKLSFQHCLIFKLGRIITSHTSYLGRTVPALECAVLRAGQECLSVYWPGMSSSQKFCVQMLGVQDVSIGVVQRTTFSLPGQGGG